VKGYFKAEAKFLLVWILGIPLVVIAVGLAVTIVIMHRH